MKWLILIGSLVFSFCVLLAESVQSDTHGKFGPQNQVWLVLISILFQVMKKTWT